MISKRKLVKQLEKFYKIRPFWWYWFHPRVRKLIHDEAVSDANLRDAVSQWGDYLKRVERGNIK